MRIYAGMDQRLPLAEVAGHARRVEGMGYDGLNVPDAIHDGLLTAQAALAATTRLRVATSVLVCFPRSPMNVAHAAWDLQAMSNGRFELGLGSQVRGNITGRYSTEWTPPAPRMREYVKSLRAIWRCWHTGEALDFRGESYAFTRMQPFFSPGPIDHPEIPIHLGAVGPNMTRLAGEVADGIMTHPTSSSPRQLREVTLPELASGAARGGRPGARVELMAAGFVATGRTPEDVARAREATRELLAFLYSTPTYWRALDLHGFGDTGRKLHELSRQGRWADMVGEVDDEMLRVLVPQGPYDEIAEILHDWYESIADALVFPVPSAPHHDGDAAAAIERLRSLAGRAPTRSAS